MSFEKKTWSDRVSEYPTRRNLIKADGTSEIVTVERSEGTVSTEGDAFSAENMNDLENRVSEAFGALSANNIKFSSTVSGLENRTNVQSAIEKVFQYGNNVRAEVLNSLKYSGLGLTEDNSWDEIFSALKERFPQQLVVYDNGTYTDGTITSFTASTTVKPEGVEIPSGYTLPVNVSNRDTSIHMYFGEGNGYGAAISNVKINVDSFKTIRINGSAGRAGATLYGVLYDVNSYPSLKTDPNSKIFNLNEDASLVGITGDYYIGIFGYAYYGDADITSIILTA